jgi:hypothetical protein
MTLSCCLRIPLNFSFSMPSVWCERKVGDSFFPELVYVFLYRILYKMELCLAYMTILNAFGPFLFHSEQYIFACFGYKNFEN